MSNQAEELIPVTAILVDDDHRLDFLPTYFGPRLMMRGESLVYAWMRRLAEDYKGGFWNYYTLTNGGFYMAPVLGRLYLKVAGNGFFGEMSSDAAGIVVTLFVLDQLAADSQGTAECDALIDRYHWLREYVADHAEAAQIYSAID